MVNPWMINLAIYHKIQDEMESLFRSRLQIQILLSISDGTKTLADLRKVTGSSSQALLPLIRKMEKGGLIGETKNDYALTPLGTLVSKRVDDFVLFLSMIKNHGEFWNNHYLEAIPYVFLCNLGELHNSTIIRDTNVNVLCAFRNFLKIVDEAREVWGVSSIMSVEHAESIAAKVRAGNPVEFIVNREVSVQLQKEPYREKIAALLPCNNFSLRVVSQPLHIRLIITDRYFSLGLYKNDKITYDVTTDLFSSDADAIAWGRRLFRYYYDRSVPFDIEVSNPDSEIPL